MASLWEGERVQRVGLGVLERVIERRQPGLPGAVPVGEPGPVALQPPGHPGLHVRDTLHRVALLKINRLVG